MPTQKIHSKKKILVDLDVLTLAFWDKKDEAKMIEKVKAGIFLMITPYIILWHLAKWNYKKLAEEIANFYETYIFDIDYLVTFNRKHLRDKEKEINNVLKKNGIGTIRIVQPSEL